VASTIGDLQVLRVQVEAQFSKYVPKSNSCIFASPVKRNPANDHVLAFFRVDNITNIFLYQSAIICNFLASPINIFQ